jgi:hypothetical protein
VSAEHEPCSWCGTPLAAGDGFRLAERAGERRAAFCRLEHVVPWAIRGAHWDPGTIAEPPPDPALEHCAQCAAALDDGRVLLVRHRAEHRVADAFCGVAHLLDWAKAGGRWA